MILGKSVHTVHFWFLFNIFISLGSEWFDVGCAPVCTKGDHISQDDKNRLNQLYDM